MDPGGITDAVRLMTVHKSKGLEFRIVIVLLSESGSKGLSPIVFHEADGMELLHITAGIARRSRVLGEIYRNERLKALTDTLNGLYVVLTRAKDELYVVAMAARDEAKVPCSLLTPCTASDADLPMADPEKPEMIEQIVLPTLHALRRHAGPVREEKLGFDETRRGDTLHAVLAQLEFVEGNLIDCVDAALARTGIPEAGRAEARRLLVAFLADSGILAYFQHAPGRRVMNEQEFTNRSGDLFRADRVVVDDAGVTVIDYKTGGQHDEEQYRTQISNYMDIAGEVLGARNVTGCIAYVDLKKLAYVVPGRTEKGRIP